MARDCTGSGGSYLCHWAKPPSAFLLLFLFFFFFSSSFLLPFPFFFFSSFLLLFNGCDTKVRSKGLEPQWVPRKLKKLALAPFVEL